MKYPSRKEQKDNIVLKKGLIVHPYGYVLTLLVVKDGNKFMDSIKDLHIWNMPEQIERDSDSRFICFKNSFDSVIIFEQDRMTYEQLAHEIFHVIMHLMWMIGNRVDEPCHHEPGAYLSGYLQQWVIQQCRKGKVKILDKYPS